MEQRKKKLVFQTDFSKVNSGFGKFAKSLLTYLYKTGKYEIIHYCCGMQWSNPDLKRTPWKSIGCWPDNPQEMEMINRDPNQARAVSYGSYYIDRIIKEEKPDVYVGSQDYWAFHGYCDRPWFSKITSALSITLDSLPLYKPAIDDAHKIKNFWMWSSFAEKEFHRLGHKHVKTVHGCIDTSPFFRLPDHKRKEIRKNNNIPDNAFIIGFVFRNQLRKAIHQLIEGYSIWKRQNPEIKNTYLLLVTHLGEGWPIPEIADEYKVPHKEILVAYACRACRGYEVKTYDNRITESDKLETQDKDCKICGTQKSQITTNVGFGVTDEQLNEIYNLMDLYYGGCTSGGIEIPAAIENKLVEMPTLMQNYSCGEEICQDGAGTLTLDWEEYREFGTNFRKSSVISSSVAKQIHKVYSMSIEKRREIGKQGRKWALDNFSVEVIGKFYEDFIDSAPFIDYSTINFSADTKNINIQIPPDVMLLEDKEFIKKCYFLILNMDVTDQDSGLIHWTNFLKQNQDKKVLRENLIQSFKMAGQEHNQRNNVIPFESLLNNNGKKRFLIICKESAGDILYSTSLLKSFRESYPKEEWDIYYSCKSEFAELLDNCPYIDKLLPYMPQMDSEIAMTGQVNNRGFFDGYCNLTVATQYILNYLTNNKINLQLS